MTYQRVFHASDLPTEGTFSAETRESLRMDFKVFANPKAGREHSKDIAAFANALGGVLVIGANEDKKNDRIVYVGIEKKGQTYLQVKQIFEDAGRECSPSISVEAVELRLEEKSLVAVNVDPYAGQLVGAPAELECPDCADKLQKGENWRFPIRVSSTTKFISPSEFPMYMEPKVRSSVLLLNKIPKKCRDLVRLVGYSTELEAELKHIDPERNIARFRSEQYKADFNIPLTRITDVWPFDDKKWQIDIDGVTKVGPGMIVFRKAHP